MIPKGKEWGVAAKIAGGVFLAWLFWLLGAVVFTATETEGRAGLFGDFFGGFSALFASLGFVGVAFTLYRQHQDGKDAEERHEDNLEIQALIALLSVKNDRLKNLEPDYLNVKDLLFLANNTFKELDSNTAIHNQSFSPLLKKLNPALRDRLASKLGYMALEGTYSAVSSRLREFLEEQLESVQNNRDTTRADVEVLENRLDALCKQKKDRSPSKA